MNYGDALVMNELWNINEILSQLWIVSMKCDYNYQACTTCDYWKGKNKGIFLAEAFFRLKHNKI